MSSRREIDPPVAVVGADYRTAATSFREKLVTTSEARARLFDAMRGVDATAGLMVLETCNRAEWIVSTTNPRWMADLLSARMSSLWQEAFPDAVRLPVPWSYLGRDAVEHILRVVVGLESLATGEAQIAGQFHDALARARDEKMASPILNRLASGAGRLAKSGSSVGFRSDCRQGIHGLSARYLARHFGRPERGISVIVLGMGSIGRRVAQLLEESPGARVLRANRTIRPEQQGSVHPLESLRRISRDADAVIVATSALEPILIPPSLALDDREERLLLLDLGIPRQVAPALAADPRVDYRTIDDLLDLPRDRGKADARDLVLAELGREIESFAAACREREMVSLLGTIHQGRRELATRRIPEVVAEELADLDDARRLRVRALMTKILNEYARDVREALQHALEESAEGRRRG